MVRVEKSAPDGDTIFLFSIFAGDHVFEERALWDEFFFFALIGVKNWMLVNAFHREHWVIKATVTQKSIYQERVVRL